MIFLAIIAAFIFVCVIVGKVNDAKRERLMKRINEIKSHYPLAFKKYLSLNNLDIDSAKNERLEFIIIYKSDYEWSKWEQQLQEEEKWKLAAERTYQDIVKSYPNGLKKWNQINPHSSKDTIISNKSQIQEFEKYYVEAQLYNTWEKEQNECRNQCLSLQKKILPNEGRYYYDIPYQKTNDEGHLINGTLGVWQIFFKSYCLESDLDYTYFEHIKKETTKIDSFKQKDRFFVEEVYKRLNEFLIEFSKIQPISVYLCANNRDWRKDNLYYHYFEKSHFLELPNNIEIIDPVTESILMDEDIDQNYYPLFKNRHVVIIEMQTDNDHLKDVCNNIIEKNKVKHPLITYISFLKGFDREEMAKLILREKKKKEEEEKRKRKEIEEREQKEKKEKEDEIFSICGQYGITGLFHMTHINNLNSILKNGLLSHTKARMEGFMKVDIANNDVNDRRFHSEPIHNKPIHDYAPLYFNPRNPMLYVRKDQQENIVLIEFSPKVFLKDGVIFSDGNAAVHGALSKPCGFAIRGCA